MCSLTKDMNMISFRNFLVESKHPDGSYMAAIPSKESMEKLATWSKENGIDKPIKSDDYHTTIVYSKKGIPGAKNYDLPLPVTCKIKEWKIFDTQAEGSGKCLVGILDCKAFEKAHNHLKKAYGATHDYDGYHPHLTFTYSFKGDEPKSKPDFDIIFDSFKFEALNKDWTSKVK